MEAAICTRCQSANPLFTKYCLICGLEITEKMRRKLAPAMSQIRSKTEETMKEQPEPAIAASAALEPAVAEDARPQKESSRWLRLLGRS
jgi:hypothetical protein